MNDLDFLMMLLPVVFMLHDFEEIIMLPAWLAKHRGSLKKRFPKIERKITERGLFTLSTQGFALAVCYMFVLLSAVSLTAVYQQAYHWWFAAFMAYFLHLFVHLAQWLIWRGYIPAIITTILTMPYCLYTLRIFATQSGMTTGGMAVWMLIGIAATLVSLPAAWKAGMIFDRWFLKTKQP